MHVSAGILMRSPIHHYLKVAKETDNGDAKWAATLALNAATEREEEEFYGMGKHCTCLTKHSINFFMDATRLHCGLIDFVLC